MAGLTLTEIKQLHDKAYTANQQTRIKAADDSLFHAVSAWDSTLLQDSQLAYKGEFDIISKARREVLADLRVNQPQVEFCPKGYEDKDAADLINGLYLTDDRLNASQEAYKNAQEECVTCGLGGWELFCEYETNRGGDKNQVIRRRPIFEFNNNAFPDPNAKLLDKSDARYWSILEPYTLEGYKDLYRELKGEESSIDSILNDKIKAPQTFANPEVSYVFPWFAQNQIFYIARFYYRERVSDKVLTYLDPLGNPVRFRESDIEAHQDSIDIDDYELVAEKPITRWQVTLYTVSGEEILHECRIPGEHIPVVPVFGERAFIEGEEVWEGIVRRAKDPQRLRNFMMSYLGDMMSRSPRPKPIFFPEQVAGFENMYAVTGAENNYPYVLMHRKTANGEDLPSQGPVGVLPGPEMPTPLPLLLQLTREAVEDVANPGLPKNFTDTDLSGVALELIQARFDNQSQVYQDHMKHAKRFDGAIYAGMASEIYDAPRQVVLTNPDGSRRVERIMDMVMDEDTGELVALNDLTAVEFEVYASIGPTYDSKREKTFKQLGEMIKDAAGDAESQKILFMKRLQLMDGVQWADVREWAGKQLILMGVKEPETDKEQEFAEQIANQPKEPSPEMVLAQAEQQKADAQMLRQQVEMAKTQAQNQVDQGKLQIDAFNAETKRMEANAKRQSDGLNGRLTQARIAGQQIKNVQDLTQPFRARVSMR